MFAAAWLILALVGPVIGSDQEILFQSRFETDQDGDGLADGWKLWGENSLEYNLIKDAGEGLTGQFIKYRGKKYGGISVSVAVKPETSYRLTFRAKSAGESGTAGVRVAGRKTYYQLPYGRESFPVTAAWTEVTREFKTTADAVEIDLIIYQNTMPAPYGIVIADCRLVAKAGGVGP